MIELSEEQKSVLSLDRDTDAIVTGPAGSGKTILAVHLAHELSKVGTVLLVTFTKALRKYVESELRKLNNNNLLSVEVNIHENIKNENNTYDFIIVDEAQDFYEKDIASYKSRKLRSLLIIGDPEQKLYTDGKRIKMSDLIRSNQYIHYELTNNYRNSKNISSFISVMYPLKRFIRGENIDNNEIVEIIGFDSVENELNFLNDYVKRNNYHSANFTMYGMTIDLTPLPESIRNNHSSIAILLNENFGIHKKTYGEIETQVYGVREFVDFFLKGRKMKVGYKYRDENGDHDRLSMSEKINVLTYHSSKGLEFDCVILPFLTPGVDLTEYGFYLTPFYTALTRARKKLILTYNGLLHETFGTLIDELENGCDYCQAKRFRITDNWDEFLSTKVGVIVLEKYRQIYPTVSYEKLKEIITNDYEKKSK